MATSIIIEGIILLSELSCKVKSDFKEQVKLLLNPKSQLFEKSEVVTA